MSGRRPTRAPIAAGADAADATVPIDPLATLLHELDTPLGVALTAVSIQAQRLDDLERRLPAQCRLDLGSVMSDLRESAQLARQGLDRAIAVLGTRRDALRTKLPAPAELLDLEGVLGDALSIPMVRFRDRIHACTLEIEQGLRVQTELHAWCQVVANLVANSALHGFVGGRAGGSITLSAQRVGAGADRVRVRYRDDGCGFSDPARADAFVRRFTSRAEGGSSGLGLCIVRDIVRDRLHGTIELLDEPGGSTVEIEIPILAPALARPAEPPGPSAPRRPRRGARFRPAFSRPS